MGLTFKYYLWLIGPLTKPMIECLGFSFYSLDIYSFNKK